MDLIIVWKIDKMFFSDHENIILESFHNKNLSKFSFFPQCNQDDTEDILCSKFGGKIPCNSEEELPFCLSCNEQHEILVQLYIPHLPQEIKVLFPIEYQECLFIIFYCTNCMESFINLNYKIYFPNDFKNLIYFSNKENFKINSKTISYFEKKITFDDSTETFYNISHEIHDDSLLIETLMRKYREEILIGKTYFLGNPRFEQGEVIPGEDFHFLMNFEDDSSFSMMWGDAGSAQLWMKIENNQFIFNLGWQSG